MTRAEVKHAIQNALPTPHVPDELVWEVLSECIAEQTGQQPPLVTLVESVQSPDAHARMRALLEASDTPRSDLKADDHVNPQATNRFLPDGIDLAAAIRRAAAVYKADGIDLNPTPRAAQMKPITLAESRAELATRIPDPIQRAYVILSEPGRPRAEVGQDENRIDLAALPDPRPMVAVTSTATRRLLDGDVRRPAPVTNALLLGQQLAEARGAARALIDRTPTDLAVMVEELRRWYYTLHPDERERLLWQHFTEAKQRHARLQHAIRVAREALDVERSALVEAQAERVTLAVRSLPATIEEESAGTRPEAVRRYQSLGVECQQREAAIAELERLLPAHEQTLGQLPDVTARVLEAVVTVDREALVRRLRESGELEQLRSRFERLRAMTNTHGADIDEWSRRVGRPVRVPRIAFPWPPEPVWPALLGAPAEAPKLVWDDDPPAA